MLSTYLIVHLICGIVGAALIEFTIWKWQRTWLHYKNILAMPMFFFLGPFGIVLWVLITIDHFCARDNYEQTDYS